MVFEIPINKDREDDDNKSRAIQICLLGQFIITTVLRSCVIVNSINTPHSIKQKTKHYILLNDTKSAAARDYIDGEFITNVVKTIITQFM